MTNEQQHIERDKELAAAGQQLSIALGLDHEELLQRQALERMFYGADLNSVQVELWAQRLDLIFPELARKVEYLFPYNEEPGYSGPCALCVGTDHSFDEEEGGDYAKSKCKVMAEKLAELLAAVPGPIERVDVTGCGYLFAEVAVKRSGEQLEAGQ